MEDEFDAPPEPSVDSDDPKERILARRLRIAKRQEALRKAQQGDDAKDFAEVKVELSQSRKQMEESYIRLRKLNEDGFEMVTNIRVAGDAREVSRRHDDEEARRQRKEKLEAEAKAGAERFEDITKKWESALQKEIPQELHEMLTQQKTSCDAMLDEKNKLITEFQSDLKMKDDLYVRDLKKQAEDIDLLIERMDNQVRELSKAYRNELEEIERAFVLERARTLEHQNKKWDMETESRRAKERDYLRIRQERVDDFERQLKAVRIQDAEEYNQVKIKLETDVQILQQQLQQMKATYQLNQEKLEYNFQVLRKRDEENTITKSHQKRKITRMQDTLTNLKRKAAKMSGAAIAENLQLTEDIRRVTEQFKELKVKSKHFMVTDAKKYNEIWEMNEEECKRLARQVLDADRAITEQQLGQQWKSPDVSFMQNVGPIKTTGPKKKCTKKLAAKVLEAANEANRFGQVGHTGWGVPGSGEFDEKPADPEMGEEEVSSILKNLSPELLKHILELMCDESGFLIEGKLSRLLAPLDHCEQTLIKLDNIFTALGVETEDDVQILSKYFTEHCIASKSPMPIPSAQQEAPPSDAFIAYGPCDFPSDPQPDKNKIYRPFDYPEPPTPSPPPASFVQYGPFDYPLTPTTQEDVEVDKEIQCITGGTSHPQSAQSKTAVEQEEEEPGVETPLPDGQVEAEPEVLSSVPLIHPNNVLKAMRAFIEDTQKAQSKGKSNASTQFIICNTNERDESEDAGYWNKYTFVISEERERVWDALIESFDKYYNVLCSRSKLIDDTEGLRQQNSELRMLLHQYVNSKVNQELEVPPTRFLQMQLNPPTN